MTTHPAIEALVVIGTIGLILELAVHHTLVAIAATAIWLVVRDN